MLTIKNLKKLIQNLPDDIRVTAYEGEDCGLQVFTNTGVLDTDKTGWIETGYSPEEECNPKKHDLKKFEEKKP